MKKRLPFIIGAILVTAYIFSNSLKDADASTVSSGRFVDLTMNILQYFNLFFSSDLVTLLVRKSAHMTEFFVQAVFVAGSFSKKYKDRIIYILFIGLLTACIDEFIQLFSEGRSGMIADVFIDFSGCIIGMLLCLFVYHFRRNKKCRI